MIPKTKNLATLYLYIAYSYLLGL